MNTATEDPRQQRGLVIARDSRLKRLVASTWLVPSQSHAGTYAVDTAQGTCTCADHELRGAVVRCKHRWAVEFVRNRVVSPDGCIVTEVSKPTYRQNWPKYNIAQTNEKDHVRVLLRALCDGIQNPSQVGPGRPRAALSDVIFSAVMKTFVGMSGRRAQSDLRACVADGYLDKLIAYNTIFAYMEREDVTPILRELVRKSA